MRKISIIIPCYYNEENIPVTMAELLDLEKDYPEGVVAEYVFIDDGSKDNTLEELLKLKDRLGDRVKVVKLSGNFGSYNAILAGMKYASGDCNVVLSADLQDPPELILKMLGYWLKGMKMVIANRESRDEPWLQRKLSGAYHDIMRKIGLKNIPKGGFDFILFDAQLRDEVVRINERNTNTLYLLAWLNYDYVSIPYKRRKREIGKSRWTLQKKIKLFIDTAVSFSFFPIRMITMFGILFSLLSFLFAVYVVIAKLAGWIKIEGWTMTMGVFALVSSFQMLALGVLGEYLWRALDASRGRPNYVVEKTYL